MLSVMNNAEELKNSENRMKIMSLISVNIAKYR